MFTHSLSIADPGQKDLHQQPRVVVAVPDQVPDIESKQGAKRKLPIGNGLSTVTKVIAPEVRDKVLHFICEPLHFPSYHGKSFSLSKHFGISQNI